jgi:hypothetical protein
VRAIDTYLDELFDRLAGSGTAGRRALAEAEDHLRSAAAEAVAAGVPLDVAERKAVARFGPADRFATALLAAHRSMWTMIQQTAVGAWVVGCVGAVAVGLSGALAAVFGTVFGAAFVSGDSAGVTYTPERCADYFEYVPAASTCAQAAAVHHLGEIEQSRMALGVLGLLGLAAYAGARRWFGLRGPQWTPSWSSVAAVLLALFGLAAVGLGGMGVMEMVFGQTDGVGANLSAGIVAGVFALAVATWSIRRVAPRRFTPG